MAESGLPPRGAHPIVSRDNPLWLRSLDTAELSTFIGSHRLTGALHGLLGMTGLHRICSHKAERERHPSVQHSCAIRNLDHVDRTCGAKQQAMCLKCGQG